MTDPIDCPFCGILCGEDPGKIIAQDPDKRFALIQNIHPEATVHWLAMPMEHSASTEQLKASDPGKFMELIEFALAQTQAQAQDYPSLINGFTIKFHIGAFETVPHAKLHVLSTE